MLTVLIVVGVTAGLPAAFGVGMAAATLAGLGSSQAASRPAASPTPASSGSASSGPASSGQPSGARKLSVAQTAGCHHERGPFHVKGTVVDGSTGRYIPYGISLTGLAHEDYQPRIADDEAGIAAAADHWCANTVRLQIRQANLVGITNHIHQPFLAAVTTEVRYAEARGLVVVLNLQWQTDRAALDESMPTQRSKAFWGALAYRFGKDPDVIFDIYNEPEQWVHCGWAFWHYGGVCGGRRYVGMQALADYVRARSSNLFWIEGIGAGSVLSEAWRYHITGDGPLEYSEHRPPGPHQYRTWDSEFGYIARSGHAPVVEGEWADYARVSAPWACWDDAPVSAPHFLHYLNARGFGLIITKFVEGQLLQSENLKNPTRFRSNWSCTDGLDEGVGRLAQQWLYQHNT
jgi:hypothetical protein